jgi:hypothetical protein
MDELNATRRLSLKTFFSVRGQRIYSAFFLRVPGYGTRDAFTRGKEPFFSSARIKTFNHFEDKNVDATKERMERWAPPAYTAREFFNHFLKEERSNQC